MPVEFANLVNNALVPGLTQWAQVNSPMVGQSIFNQGLQYPTLGVPQPWVPGAQAPTGMQPNNYQIGGGVKGGSSNYSTGTTPNPALDDFFNSFTNTTAPKQGGKHSGN
jgi:hypothetical protein